MFTELWRLGWSDLKATWLSWTAVAVTLLVSATGTAFSLAVLITGEEDAGELGGTVLGFALIGIIAAVTSSTGLVVNERRRTYARWKLLGLPGSGVFCVVLLQVLVVGAVAAFPGALLAVPLVPPAADYLATQDAPVGQPEVTSDVLWVTVGVCLAAAVCGVTGRALSVARVRPVVALRAAVVPKARPGVLATGMGVMFAVSLVMLITSEDLSENGAVVGAQLILLMTVVPLTGWFLPLILQWTRVLHVFGTSARVAADSARIRTAFTSAQVLPWFLVAGSVVGIGSPIMVMLRSEGGQISGLGIFAVMFGPAVVPPLVAGLSSVLVMRPRRRQDEAVLLRAGASRLQQRMVGWWESAAVVASAGILTLLFTVPGLGLTNHVYIGTAWPTGWWRDILWGPLAVILVMMWLLITAVIGVAGVSTGRRVASG
jgi:predicted lysophospholipase L1 biosynthesis ABC-type transport system permease subunit